MNALLYIHGNGGSAMESEHYKLLFPDCDVIGLDYQTFSPWETDQEIRIAVEELKSKYDLHQRPEHQALHRLYGMSH